MGKRIGEWIRILIIIKVWILVINRREEIWSREKRWKWGGRAMNGGSLAATHACCLLLIIYIFYVNLIARVHLQNRKWRAEISWILTAAGCSSVVANIESYDHEGGNHGQ